MYPVWRMHQGLPGTRNRFQAYADQSRDCKVRKGRKGKDYGGHEGCSGHEGRNEREDCGGYDGKDHSEGRATQVKI